MFSTKEKKKMTSAVVWLSDKARANIKAVKKKFPLGKRSTAEAVNFIVEHTNIYE